MGSHGNVWPRSVTATCPSVLARSSKRRHRSLKTDPGRRENVNCSLREHFSKIRQATQGNLPNAAYYMVLVKSTSTKNEGKKAWSSATTPPPSHSTPSCPPAPAIGGHVSNLSDSFVPLSAPQLRLRRRLPRLGPSCRPGTPAAACLPAAPGHRAARRCSAGGRGRSNRHRRWRHQKQQQQRHQKQQQQDKQSRDLLLRCRWRRDHRHRPGKTRKHVHIRERGRKGGREGVSGDFS